MVGHSHSPHSPHYNYSGHSSPRGVYSYQPQFWRQSHPPQTVVVNRGAREGEDNSTAMRTAVYVGAGALGIVGIGALIYLIAKK